MTHSDLNPSFSIPSEKPYPSLWRKIGLGRPPMKARRIYSLADQAIDWSPKETCKLYQVLGLTGWNLARLSGRSFEKLHHRLKIRMISR